MGNTQPTRFRDAWAALLFIAKQGWILYMAVAWGWPALRDNNDNDNNNNDNDNNTTPWLQGSTLTLWMATSLVALLAAVAIVACLVRVAPQVLQASLGATVLAQGALALYLLLTLVVRQGGGGRGGSSWLACLVCTTLAMVTAWYAKTVWQQIPAAARQLSTACQALQQNGSILIVAVAMAVITSLWICIVWMLALYGVVYGKGSSSTSTSASTNAGWMLLWMLLSLVWTVQVSANIVHVTVSGTVGTWWFCPDEANRFWSAAVRHALVRSMTYSFGSICLGSLLTAAVHVLHVLARQATRRQRQNNGTTHAGLLLCILDCLLRCTERLLNYFNKWAFVYVGLYGYDYLTAGQKAITLFQERGWTNIIQDDLILRCLQLVTLALGCVSGVTALALANWHPSFLADTWRYHNEDGSNGSLSKTAWSFIFAMGFGVGTAMGQLLLGVVASAANTVMVTWAEAPLELERHYPGLYAAQVAAWRQAYPQEFTM